MDMQLYQIWVYLEQTPLLWLTATIGVHQLATLISRRFGSPPLLNPVLLAITALVSLLLLTGTPYQVYFDGAQFVHFLSPCSPRRCCTSWASSPCVSGAHRS